MLDGVAKPRGSFTSSEVTHVHNATALIGSTSIARSKAHLDSGTGDEGNVAAGAELVRL
jgi:hypothetical protein